MVVSLASPKPCRIEWTVMPCKAKSEIQRAGTYLQEKEGLVNGAGHTLPLLAFTHFLLRKGSSGLPQEVNRGI